ncbi:MAG: methylated-DNA--[protein]-cysteine S-methyltransferase [Croceitalea sp.]|nr:methylated-DNA--[protein]-cysteine S-methyltransferase [Croceitalea sp.]MBT8239322.1 methylated-DNA--[protein]-cysteine S-methyltransferase [Croceitalea sp.]NNC33997.1 methylated-DNA--[protein]-cysteine S-methyltransferase [Croceitalea sp.]NNL09680.1 methylated-DNA--[protein]-cysteine S-methyltransferase [Croceitalea sp.]NNM18440.1 methylated-DNA--[protein]-cysteine S-methyltransferase [Croceitalea sp.]
MEIAYLQTDIGYAEIKGDKNGLVSITVFDGNKPNSIIPDVLEDAVYQLKEYFNGERQVFDLQLNPSGTDFQKKVWQGLMEIPYGKTMSYLGLSKKLGDAKAIRAVAAANGKNPLWIVIPCHRVIGSNGELTGYAGGLHRKSWLLEHESPYKQQKLF